MRPDVLGVLGSLGSLHSPHFMRVFEHPFQKPPRSERTTIAALDLKAQLLKRDLKP